MGFFSLFCNICIFLILFLKNQFQLSDDKTTVTGLQCVLRHLFACSISSTHLGRDGVWESCTMCGQE